MRFRHQTRTPYLAISLAAVPRTVDSGGQIDVCVVSSMRGCGNVQVRLHNRRPGSRRADRKSFARAEILGSKVAAAAPSRFTRCTRSIQYQASNTPTVRAGEPTMQRTRRAPSWAHLVGGSCKQLTCKGRTTTHLKGAFEISRHLRLGAIPRCDSHHPPDTTKLLKLAKHWKRPANSSGCGGGSSSRPDTTFELVPPRRASCAAQ
jgi:hypothetical protein